MMRRDFVESLWRKTVRISERDPLAGDLKTQAAVVGGGMAGILTAWYLQRRGIQTVVLEAGRIGSGQTEGTTAKLTCQHGLIYRKLLDTLGEERAALYAAANQRAVSQYRQLIEEKHIDCRFEEKPAYLYTLEDSEPLKREAEAAQRLGIPARFTTRTALPFVIKGALRFDGQAQFHPLELLRALADELTIYERTRVLAAEGNRLETECGTVTAEQIIFCTHYPFLNLPGYYFMRMHQERSYVLALENAMELDGMYLGIDQENGWSLRNSGPYLLLGGGNHRTGENRQGGRYDLLRKKAVQLWPDSREIAHWSAQDCMPLDDVPYIGQYAASTPNWYVATGFKKWGMTTSMVAAQLIARLVSGETPEEAQLFSPQRFTPGASAKQFLEDGLHAVRDLSRQVFAPPRAQAEALPRGHGGVVEWDGQKLGVYKDEEGTLWTVSTRCPHLGCQLEWNPDEKSWDCPCHGSRFDYRGRLIDNPAQEGLSHV